MASLIITSGKQEGDYFPLGKRTTVIGRDEAVPFQILDERVSRRHLQIRFEPQDQHYHLLDMKSTHGSFVNGRRIEAEIILVDGDVVQIGDTRLLFTTEDFADKESALRHYKQVGQRGKTTLMG